MKKLVLFGAGKLGKKAQKDIGNEKIAFFVDNNKSDECIDGIKVLSFDEFLTVKQDYNVVITNKLHWKDIKKQLLEHNIETYAIYAISDWGNCGADVTYGELVDMYVKNNDINQEAYFWAGDNPMANYVYDLLVENGVNMKGIIVRPEENMVDIKAELVDKDYALSQKCVKKLIANVDIYEDDFWKEWNSKDWREGWELRENYKCDNVFDSDKITKYKNAHKGEKCFIIGTGPSLKIEDLERLHKHGMCCLATNKIYLAFDKTEWRPDYYLVQDALYIQNNADEIKKIKIKEKFVSDSYLSFWDEENDAIKYHVIERKIYSKMPKFSSDIARGIYNGWTVTYSAMQIAAYMGFSEIYLLGVDFNIIGNICDERNHFIKGYYSKNEKVSNGDQEVVLHAYMSAKKYADDNGIKIYNATRGGKLEVFERVNFDDIIGE